MIHTGDIKQSAETSAQGCLLDRERDECRRIIEVIRSRSGTNLAVHCQGLVSRQSLIFQLLDDGLIDVSDIRALKSAETLVDRKHIISRVASEFGMTPEDLCRARNRHHDCRARNIAFYIMRYVIGLSFVEIGRPFYGKDHKTVANGIERLEMVMDEESLAPRVRSLSIELDRSGIARGVQIKAPAQPGQSLHAREAV